MVPLLKLPQDPPLIATPPPNRQHSPIPPGGPEFEISLAEEGERGGDGIESCSVGDFNGDAPPPCHLIPALSHCLASWTEPGSPFPKFPGISRVPTTQVLLCYTCH